MCACPEDRALQGSNPSAVVGGHTDGETGQELACLRGHEGLVLSVAWDHEGKRIVSGSWDVTVRVWDALTAECLEVVQGNGDVAAIARGLGPDTSAGMGPLPRSPAPPWWGLPWWAVAQELETAIERTETAEELAWFPMAFWRNGIAPHPNGRAWAGGGTGGYLAIFTLEGNPPTTDEP